MTEYLVVTLAFVLLCGCAIVAYTGLDAIERDEEERALRAVIATPGVATTDVPVRFASVTAHVDWLDERVRGVEEQLDQLVRDSQHAPRS